MVQANVIPESNKDVVIRLMKRGGYVLVAGGGVNDLSEKIRQHPQIILWDDNDQSNEHKKVPTNTRAILYNRWLSHALAGRLRQAAAQIGCPVFPMLRSAEIKSLLGELIQEEAVVPEQAPSIDLPDETPEIEHPALLTKDDVMRKPKRGELAALFPKILKDGSIADEARRLLPILKDEYGIKQTPGALAQAIGKYKNAGGKTTKTGTKGTDITTSEGDDFAEAEKMLKDTKAAIDLLIDFIPKLRREMMELRKKQAKLKALLD